MYIKISSFTLLISVLIFHHAHGQARVEQLMDTGYEKYLNGHYENAIDDFTHILKKDTANAEAFFLRGVCFSALENHQQAINDLETATHLKPDYFEAYYEIGFIYLSNQNAGMAIAAFDKVLSINEDYVEAYVSRGTAKCMLEDQKGANKDWKIAKKMGAPYSEYMICE